MVRGLSSDFLFGKLKLYMILGPGSKQASGFTIVELLIVVVVIAILAAITIVAYNGIQSRANESAVKAEVVQNAKAIVNAANVTGSAYATSSVMANGDVKLSYSSDKYRVVSYCTNGTDSVLAFETKAGKKYYSRSSNISPVNDDSISTFRPCFSLGMTGTVRTTYTNLPAPCAVEGGVCNFSGPATVVYGHAAIGQFNQNLNATSGLTCNHATFGGDPASGYQKSCYVYPN